MLAVRIINRVIKVPQNMCMLPLFITKYNLWQSEEQSGKSIFDIREIWVYANAGLLFIILLWTT